MHLEGPTARERMHKTLKLLLWVVLKQHILDMLRSIVPDGYDPSWKHRILLIVFRGLPRSGFDRSGTVLECHH